MADMVIVEPPSWKKGVAELIGTFALIYIGVMVLVATPGRLLVEVALAHAIILGVMVSALMSISGGQFNPAVTLGLLVGRKITLQQSIVNWVFQLAGGVLGGLLAKWSVGGASIAGGIPNLAPGVTMTQGILIETIATFFLVTVVYGTAVDPRFGGRLGGLAIGLTIGADIMAVGPLTGASMNTARWLGPAITDGAYWNALSAAGRTGAVIGTHLIGPLLGALIAGVLWSYVLLDEPRPHPEPQAQMRAKGNP